MPDYQAIAREINATRAKLGREAHTEMTLDVLAMRVASHLSEDPAFNKETFATTAGVPATATHLV